MNKKKRIALLFLVLFVIVIGVIYFLVISSDKNAFSVSEKKWIESNKNQLIDIAVLNDLPYFGVNGDGIFFDFINDLEKTTGLSFNMISYNIGEKPLESDLVFEIADKASKEDISFYTDYYVVVGTKSIFSIDELQNKRIGILKDDINLGSYYLKAGTIDSYDNVTALFQAYDNGTDEYIVIPYLPNVKSILEKNYNIAYRLVDMANQYVLSSNSKEDKLNSIILKYFNVWMEESFTDAYKDEFVNLYFTDKKIDDQTKSTLLSKTYTYGYVSNLPYEKVVNGELEGINKQYINSFMSLTGAQIVYKKYNTLDDLKTALEKGKIDLAFGYFNTAGVNGTITSPVYKSDYVVLSHASNDVTIDSVKSLDNSKILTIRKSMLYSYLNVNTKADIKTYNTIGELLRKTNKDSIVVIDRQTYDYYKTSEFKHFNVVYEGVLDKDYSFVVSDRASDKVFNQIFNYYINTINKNGYLNLGYNDLINSNLSSSIINLIVKYILYVSVGALIVFYTIYRVMINKKVKRQIKKEDKLKFVDMLTSLKNRNYLNYNMPKWDENEIYPQAIVIVDLNNVQYINDNFGHEEGDNVIISAANILINSQLENSDIIRTDGNEFLIYLIGYKEDEIISYIRKLNKEFKGLPHGFGAALGYSIIKDGITTIDDAINEATLDMRTNKESLQD